MIKNDLEVDPQSVGIGSFILNKIVKWAKKYGDADLKYILITDNSSYVKGSSNAFHPNGSTYIESEDDKELQKTKLRKTFYSYFGFATELKEVASGVFYLRTKPMKASDLILYDINKSSKSKRYVEECIEKENLNNLYEKYRKLNSQNDPSQIFLHIMNMYNF